MISSSANARMFDVGFTSQMEEALDDVEAGSRNWVEMLESFYKKFQGWQASRPSSIQHLSKDDAKELLAFFGDGSAFDEPVVRGGKTTMTQVLHQPE